MEELMVRVRVQQDMGPDIGIRIVKETDQSPVVYIDESRAIDAQEFFNAIDLLRAPVESFLE